MLGFSIAVEYSSRQKEPLIPNYFQAFRLSLVECNIPHGKAVYEYVK